MGLKRLCYRDVFQDVASLTTGIPAIHPEPVVQATEANAGTHEPVAQATEATTDLLTSST